MTNISIKINNRFNRVTTAYNGYQSVNSLSRDLFLLNQYIYLHDSTQAI